LGNLANLYHTTTVPTTPDTLNLGSFNKNFNCVLKRPPRYENIDEDKSHNNLFGSSERAISFIEVEQTQFSNVKRRLEMSPPIETFKNTTSPKPLLIKSINNTNMDIPLIEDNQCADKNNECS